MTIVEKLLNLFITTPALSTLILLALFIASFTGGMSSGFKASQRRKLSFISNLANGWARGILFLIPLVILWGGIGFFSILMLSMDTGFDNGGMVAFYFFVGLVTLILTPGINIARRIRAQYPVLIQRKATMTATMWALIYPLCLLPIIALAALLDYFRLVSWRVITISWGAFGIAVAILLVNLFISKAVGKRLTIRRLQTVIEAESVIDKAATSHFWGEYIHNPPPWIVWLQHPSISRTRVGWALVWGWLSWGVIVNFELPIRMSFGVFLRYVVSFIFIFAPIVSGGAGIAAALLMRDSATSWRKTLRTTKTWFIVGMQGWAAGLFAGFIITFIYELTQTFMSHQITVTLNRVAESVILSKMPWIIGGVLALFVAHSMLQQKRSERIDKEPIYLPPILRGAISWVPVWVLLTWAFTRRFAIYGGYSNYALLWLTLRYCLLTAFTVSISAGLAAALLVREPSTPWSQTWKTALRWIYNGLLGWAFGIPIGWLAVMSYQKTLNLLSPIRIDSQGLIRVGSVWRETGQSSLLASGFIALIAGFILVKNFSTSVSKPENTDD